LGLGVVGFVGFVGFTVLPLLAGIVLSPGFLSCASLSVLPSAVLLLAGRLARLAGLLARVRSRLRWGVQITRIVLRHGGVPRVVRLRRLGRRSRVRDECEGQAIQTSTYVLNGVDPLQSVLCV
jgi:hypothetical protein